MPLCRQWKRTNTRIDHKRTGEINTGVFVQNNSLRSAPDELAILSQLLYRDHIGVADFIKEYQKTYGIKISTSQVSEAIQVLQGHFVSKEAEYQKFRKIDILENDQSGMIRRLQSYTERLAHIQFYTQVEDIIKVGIARYKDKYFPGRIVDSPFVLYEKYSRRDVSFL